jgi:hypothetical protein
MTHIGLFRVLIFSARPGERMPVLNCGQSTTIGDAIIATKAAAIFAVLAFTLVLTPLFAEAGDGWQPPFGSLYPNAYPGGVKSPNGRYVVKNDYRDLQNCGGQTPPCVSLDLVDTRTGKSTLMYKYWRWVRVLWSPSSKAVIVNDYGGSDFSLCILFLLSPRVMKIDLGARLLASHHTGPETTKFGLDDHVYIYAVKWLGDDRVLLKVTGLGNENFQSSDSFTELYAYRIGDSFELKESLRKYMESMETNDHHLTW